VVNHDNNTRFTGLGNVVAENAKAFRKISCIYDFSELFEMSFPVQTLTPDSVFPLIPFRL